MYNNVRTYTSEEMRFKSIQRRKKPIYGIGINDIDAFTRGTKVYLVWKSMLARCYCEDFQKKNPAYVGCSVCKEWHKLSTFKEWFDTYYKDGYELDKDILIPGNKVYSPQTCRFVPRHLNKIFHRHVHSHDDSVGVSHQYKSYIAECRIGKRRQRKSFELLQDAVLFYKEKRKLMLTELANQYFNEDKIDKDIYNSIIYAVQ